MLELGADFVDFQPLLLLMSDGDASNQKENGMKEMAELKKKFPQLLVYVIGFGKECVSHRSTLDKLALQGGGKFCYAPDGNQLKDIFEEISTSLKM